ncbi:MAG: sugar phosphate isomerase/epimerase family protein [Candidatus Methanomethylophilaceae archaeon]|nr:sugar phosphate isomerase [Methanomassiliicoccales archaeon RumEn M2]MDD4454516.1 sugar phosphate isomerase/epimerase [Candidatus Methanomethylophilaceae archaeon]MDI9378357.1 sugar phosphate isomerase/epimerase family protein [Candidatus Thermoplasmatota archaeon]
MIGVSSTSFSAYRFEDVLEEVSKEFELWEIFSEAEHYVQNISGMLAVMAPSYDLKYSVHAPICDTNIASLNERMREASVLDLISLVESALTLNVSTITVHPGVYSLVVPDLEEKSVAAAKKSLRTLDRIMAEYGIKVAVENMPNLDFMLGRTPQELADLVEGTELGICFDIGHANTVGDIDGFIDLLGSRFVNVHLHDNRGKIDEHLVLGEGNVDFGSALKKLSSYKGNYVIESRDFPSAVESRDILRQML